MPSALIGAAKARAAKHGESLKDDERVLWTGDYPGRNAGLPACSGRSLRLLPS
jgi:hypothetical protein